MKNLLKSNIIVLLILLIFASCQAKNGQYNPKCFDIHRGVNLSSWYDAGDRPVEELDRWITYEYIDKAKEFGLDHFRVPVREDLLFSESLDYREEYWLLLEDRIRYCHSIGLKTIIDMHVSRVHNSKDKSVFTSEASEKHFMDVWERMQKRLCKYPNKMLAYEMLNEAQAPKDATISLDQLTNEWIRIIRRKEPKRFLFIGTDDGNRPWRVKYLHLPKDKYLVLTYHTYTPAVFTHYQAEWSSFGALDCKVLYPGKAISDNDYNQLPNELKTRYANYNKVFDKEFLEKEIEGFLKYAHQHNLQMYCGEFGCRRTVEDKERYQWFSDVVSIMDVNSISYSMWGFRDIGFGLWNAKGELDIKQVEIITNKNIKNNEKTVNYCVLFTSVSSISSK